MVEVGKRVSREWWAAKNKSPGGCEQHSSVLSLEAGCVWDASPSASMPGSQRRPGPNPRVGLPPHTEHPWGPLPAEPSEMVHSLVRVVTV